MKRTAVACVAAAGLLVLPATVSADAPLISVSDVMVEATGPSGASVDYPIVSSDDNGPPEVVCTPPEGSTFPLGKSTASCTATDTVDPAQPSTKVDFSVTVQDTTAPTLTLPDPITAEATGPGGATVSYTAAASDIVSEAITPSCSPASGGTFLLGSTTVNCSATDQAGNTANGAFTVTVRDTTPPTLTLPGATSVEATSPDGAAVTYTATASDSVSGDLSPSCAPQSGATFSIGSTTVECSATDAAGNKATGEFNVTVTDTTAPVITVPAPQIKAEAADAKGTRLTYTMPTALDAVDGPTPVSCSPTPGTRFPLGRTGVHCTTTDTHGNVASASFSVLVVDTTPPVLTVPAPLTVSSRGAAQLSASDPAIASFLNAATAIDTVSGALPVKNDAAGTFAPGTTAITFSARDASGNTVSASSSVTVTTQPVGPAKPADRTPPDDVRGVAVTIGNRQLKLTWKPPRAADFDHVGITRSSTVPGASEWPVYQGSGTSFSDKRVLNGTDYRYVIIAYDHAGNRSAGIAVVAAPKAPLLVRPANGAKITLPPMLLWVPSAGASYYNVQVFRGRQKINSAWPATDRLKLPATWTYARRRFRLTPGLYRWYVFPGYGARGDSRYGPVLGTSTFIVTKAAKQP
jgi:HYR domain-containing protein